MLYTIAAFLVLLWIIGMVSENTMGGFIHSLPVIAAAAVLLRLNLARRFPFISYKKKFSDTKDEQS